MTARRRVVGLAGVALWLVAGAVQAGAPKLVKDINPKPIAIDSSPTDFADLGATSFFDASDGVHGHEPWSTDGTPEGTFMWGDLRPGPIGVVQRTVTHVGNRAFLTDTDPQLGTSLWVSDGTRQGTYQIQDALLPATGITALGAFGNEFAFTTTDASLSGWVLWLSDGTEAGTRTIFTGPSENMIAGTIIAGSKIYIFSQTASGIVEPWVSDGTQSGTRKLSAIPGAIQDIYAPPRPIRAGNYVYFDAMTQAEGRELWRIDIRDDSLGLVRDIVPGSGSGLPPGVLIGAVNELAIFAVDNGGANQTIWRSDGSSAGTFELADASPWMGAFPQYVLNGAANRLLFTTHRDGALALWATDGSESGTVLLNNFAPAVLIATTSRFYYTNEAASEVWTSDGTAAGTRQLNVPVAAAERVFDLAGTDSDVYVRTRGNLGVGHIYRHALGSSQTVPLLTYSHQISLNTQYTFGYAQNRLYFDNETAELGRELWTSDGTSEGTRLFMNLAPDTQTFDSSPSEFVRFGDKVFFTADDGDHGREVWYSDGTNSGTQLLVDLQPGLPSSTPSDLFVYNGSLYFFALNAVGAWQLWRSDGTAAGTRALRALRPRLSPRWTGCDSKGVTMNGNAFFVAYDETATLRLWRTNGTSEGTESIAVSDPNTDGNLCELTAVNNRLYFRAFSDDGYELWSSDGTSASTGQVKDMVVGNAHSFPHALTEWNDLVYFLADEGVHGRRLWRSDGTEAGTRIAVDFAGGTPIGIARPPGSVLLVAVHENMSTPATMWSTDGITTTKLSSEVFVFSDDFSTTGALTYFSGRYVAGSTSDVEPWVSDGTAAGTRLLLDTTVGHALPLYFTDFDGITLFNTTNAALWRTDGTASGTKTIGHLVLGPERLSANHNLFFASNDGTTGSELFVVPNDQPIASADTLPTMQAGSSIQAAVLTNDSDPDGTLIPASVRIIQQPAGGSVSVDGAGIITYTARSNFSGTDTFSYSVSDEQGFASNSAAVTVSVTAAPPTPTPPGGNGGGSRPSGGGGGGSVELSDLLAALTLLLLANRRRRGLRNRHQSTSAQI